MNQVLAREYAAWLNEEKDAFGTADQALADEYAAWVSEDVGDSEGASEAMASVNATLAAEETDANDADDAEEAEQITIELADERDQTLESEIYQDEHSAESAEPSADVGTETIKREMLKTAIGRIESAARTQRDFENVVVCWDKLEQNAGRRA